MDIENNEVELELPEVQEGEEDTTDWKAKATEAYAMAKRYQSKLKKLSDTPKETKSDSQPAKQGFDYSELAYLAAKGISDDEISFVEETVKETGKQLKDLLGAKWFQSELKERNEAKSAKAAIPSGSKRASTSTRDSLDYWVAKGEIPPADQPKLRREYVRAKMALETMKSKFTDNSVV